MGLFCIFESDLCCNLLIPSHENTKKLIQRDLLTLDNIFCLLQQMNILPKQFLLIDTVFEKTVSKRDLRFTTIVYDLVYHYKAKNVKDLLEFGIFFIEICKIMLIMQFYLLIYLQLIIQ